MKTERPKSKYATLRVAQRHRDRLFKIAQAKRWKLNVAAEAAIDALEREQSKPSAA